MTNQSLPPANRSTGAHATRDRLRSGLLSEATIQEMTARRNAAKARAEASASGAQAGAMGAQGNMMMAMATGVGSAAQGAIAIGGIKKVAGKSLMASGPWTFAAGAAMIALGAAQVVMGLTQQAQANTMAAQGTSKLQEAADLGITTKKQTANASKEMQRSTILKQKISTLESMQQQLGTQEDISQEDAEKMLIKLEESRNGQSNFFDNMYENAAQSLADGGIMTVNPLDENGEPTGAEKYFIKDGEGFLEVSIQTDENGQPIRDEFGALQIDLEGASTAVDPSHPDYAQISMQFMLRDQLTAQLTGQEGEDGFPALSTIRLDEDGNVVKDAYNINDPVQMQEFADLVKTTNLSKIASGELPPPLMFSSETTTGEDGEEVTELYFQEHDWISGESSGDKVSFTDLLGGEYDANDPDSVAAARERANAEFEALGLIGDGARAELLNALTEESFANDIANFENPRDLSNNYINSLGGLRTGYSVIGDTSNLRGSSGSLRSQGITVNSAMDHIRGNRDGIEA